MTQGNHIIQGSIVSKPDLIKSSIAGGIPTAWDSGLDVSTAPRYGTTLRDAETNLESKQPKKRMKTEMQDDLVMTEVVDIAFDHQRSLRTNSTAAKKNLMAGWEQTSGCMTVSNRTVVNKVLYTNEDAPEMVLIHVPLILRPNSYTGTLSFNFELTYMVKIECCDECLIHPQKVPLTNHVCAIAAMSENFNYQLGCIVPPNRHLHDQTAKGMPHNHSTHIFNHQEGNMLGYGQFINK